MQPSDQTLPDKGKRLVLGFDAGCMACSQLAEKIEEAVGEKLETASLADPRMTEWRRQALGEDAPWAPTLVEVADGEVRAWIGIMMGARLVRKLGPAATLKVVRVLGEIGDSSRARPASQSAFSRSQFLKGLGGAVVGMSVLSGTGSLASPATAEEAHWLSRLSISSSKELSRKQAAAAWTRLTRGRHLRRLLSSRAVEQNAVARRMSGRMLADIRNRTASQPTATIKGVRHQLEGGGRLLALVYQEDDALVVTYRLDKPDQKTRQLSRVIEDAESEDLIRVIVEAEDGDVFAAPQDAASEGELTVAALRRCRRNSQCPGACYVCRCASYNRTCAFNCCAWCAFPCKWGTWAACLSCVLAFCPVCMAINRCCNYKACLWREACA